METVVEQRFQWALTRKQTFSGGGSLQIGDLRRVENGSQRSGTLGSDVVGAISGNIIRASETASGG